MDDINLSPVARRTKGSSTFAMTLRANKLREEGKEIIALNVGEPDFDTPDHIREAACLALKTKKSATRYAPVKGMPSLRSSVAEKLKRDNNLSFSTDQIIISSGAKQAIFNGIGTIVAEGDEVIIPAPYWVSYADMVVMSGAVPVPVVAGQDQGFKITPSQLEQSISPRSKLMLINSPSNPTGAMYSERELFDLMQVVLKHPNIVVISDEIYEHITIGDQKHFSPLQVAPDLANRFILINGVSKAYAMTGWRIGFAAGPRKIIDAMANIQSQQSGSVCSVSQLAAETALNGPQDCVHRMRDAFAKRHQLVLSRFANIEGFRCSPAQGGFYLFIDVTDAVNNLYKREKISSPNDVAFCDYLLEEAGVALMPGTFSGFGGHIRLSFAASTEVLNEAADRIALAVAKD
ncbi:MULTISPECIES: pyridoxal phosphate-dependent aminotransferase [Candidatus Ichthyocystis]|uniref:Aminotransferase n=1 Tax=Candidatus Ichthyocystis hellenicum TaxID=1561003 RepID=A0A0S4M1J7_9BURK|nr:MULTISPECIES: pyridoxal phosphate-dependent aminotransferase [Ichthyocystis]CUT16895.1 Aspartate aminotransferase [Candidatus Ichthyocystis hellenicum]